MATPEVSQLSQSDRMISAIDSRIELLVDVSTSRDSSEGQSAFALVSLGNAIKSASEAGEADKQLEALLVERYEQNAALFDLALEWAAWDNQR